jgi:hypothetical protein
MIKREKKGQFYIIAAVIIILVILGLVGVKNYISVKKEPKQFADVGEILELEGRYVIENSAYNNEGTVEENIQAYLMLFSSYMEQNTNEDFSLIIVYGNIDGGVVSARRYYRTTSGDVTLNTGATQYQTPGSSAVQVEDTSCTVNAGTPKTANCTIVIGGKEMTQTVPILEDNNFVFVLTTSEGLSQFIERSFEKQT